MKYSEEKTTGNRYREEYLSSLNEMICGLQKEADKTRHDHFVDMMKNQEEYRLEFKKMLGWPLTEYDETIPPAAKQLVTAEDDMSVYRLQLELPIGIKFYGLYIEHTDKGRLPLVITQHGGEGTPELCSGLFPEGTANYNDMVMRAFNKGVNVFVPQLLLWKPETYGIEYDRVGIDAKLKQLGSSVTAVEVYSIMKSIDYLTAKENVDGGRIGMIGLSYGGFYTLFTAAVDTRIKAALASSQYNNRYEYSWTDWTWFDSADKFLDNEAACLIFPRYLSIALGDKDELFRCDLGKEEFDKLKKMTGGRDWPDFRIFDGGHEFIKDDDVIEKLLSHI